MSPSCFGVGVSPVKPVLNPLTLPLFTAVKRPLCFCDCFLLITYSPGVSSAGILSVLPEPGTLPPVANFMAGIGRPPAPEVVLSLLYAEMRLFTATVCLSREVVTDICAVANCCAAAACSNSSRVSSEAPCAAPLNPNRSSSPALAALIRLPPILASKPTSIRVAGITMPMPATRVAINF